MKNMLSLFALLALILLASCSSGEKKKEQADKAFFPVNAQVLAELKSLDSMPLAVFRFRKDKDGHMDTTIVTKEALREAVKPLLDADITSPKESPKYEESVYIDQSVGSVTMSYVPKKDITNTAVSKIDVYLDPANDKMKQVYVEASGPWAGDSTVLRKMLWAPGKYFQVTTLISAGDTSTRWFDDKYSWETPN